MNSLFISSTFHDMQQERDIIQKRVLPEIKDFVKQYGKSIEICDFRWGVNTLDMDEMDSGLKILQVCFDEIDKARPFFLALVGDRYGSIPNKDIVTVGLSGKNVSKTEMMNKSVTEMEIIYGALHSADTSCVRVYLRNINNANTLLLFNPDIYKQYFSIDNENRERVKSLRNRLKQQIPEVIREYDVTWNNNCTHFDGIDNFADILIEDLKEIIVKKWGPPSLLSEYDSQFYQYQYALENDSYISNAHAISSQFDVLGDYKGLTSSMIEHQNYILVSKDEYNLNLVFGMLSKIYTSNRIEVIPYVCNQSLLSSSLENMLQYYINILCLRFDVGDIRNCSILSVHDLIKQFHNVLNQVDQKTRDPIVLAIQGAQYLRQQVMTEWLPKFRYKNIHFVISLNRVLSMPNTLKELSRVFFFPESCIFEQNTMMNLYMAKHHKEMDQNIRNAILEKSQGKDMRYTEFLMQRLLALSQSDFEKIRGNGDGIEHISRYLLGLVAKAPDNMEDMMFEQIDHLGSEVGKKFAYAVLSILVTLPYGISKQELEYVLHAGEIDFSSFYLSILSRGLPTVIVETIDGYYRIPDRDISEIIHRKLIVESAYWVKTIGDYMNGLLPDEIRHNASVRDLYRNQFLIVARLNNMKDAISKYLKNIDYNTRLFDLVLRDLIETGKNDEWLVENTYSFSVEDIRWFVNDFCEYLSQAKTIDSNETGRVILKMLRAIISVLNNDISLSDREDDNYLFFMALYYAGEIAWIIGDECAEQYLIEAKEVSKHNFRRHPNRLWKLAHGIELTEEEKRAGYDYLESQTGKEIPKDVIFGMPGEMEDMDTEQSWSGKVRIIDNYLSALHRGKNEEQKAIVLEKEAKRITHIEDPDPFHRGENIINEYMTIIWPDELEGPFSKTEEEVVKHIYKPAERRNSAIEIAKEARQILREGSLDSALLKYEESNSLLLEIYEDGEDGKYYDLSDVEGDLDAIRVLIQKECARDLGLNYRMMLHCIQIHEGDSRVHEYVHAMISYGLIYDEYKNNRQSKADLECYYLTAATVYMNLNQSSVYFERILDYVDHYFSYRLEAHRNGEVTDQNIMDERKRADKFVYQIIIENPFLGPWSVDFLRKQVNETSKADDFNGYTDLINLIRNLLKWMFSNEYEWRGKVCSLEDLYINCAENLCMLWQKYSMIDRLKCDVDIIFQMLPDFKESNNIMIACNCVMGYMNVLLKEGEYKKAVKYGEEVLTTLLKEEDKIPLSNIIIAQEKLIAAYSESGELEKALLIGQEEERLLKRMVMEGLSKKERMIGMTAEGYRQFIIGSKLTFYLNYAIVYSRIGDELNAQKYLDMTSELANAYPEIAAEKDGLVQRISLFRKKGLPKSKDIIDPEKEYRGHLSEIEKNLSHYGKSQYTKDDLNNIEQLIQKVCAMPENSIFGDTEMFVRYYYVLGQMYQQIGERNEAYLMLKKAVDLIEEKTATIELYAIVCNDICAYLEQDEEIIYYANKAVGIFEQLRKDGKKYSMDSYAMSLFNLGVILMRLGQHDKAIENAERSYYIWGKMYNDHENIQTLQHMNEAKRLVRHLKGML